MEWGEPIFQYTSKDAEEDGVLINILKLNKEWEKGLFSHITSNLLETHNYFDEDKLNLVNVCELLNQCIHIIKKKSNNFQDFDTFFSGYIETPNGEKVKIFIAQNELNKFTIMLPEDY